MDDGFSSNGRILGGKRHASLRKQRRARTLPVEAKVRPTRDPAGNRNRRMGQNGVVSLIREVTMCRVGGRK